MPATCKDCGAEIFWVKTGEMKEDGKPKYHPPADDPHGTVRHICPEGTTKGSGSRAGKVSLNLKKDIDEIKGKLDLVLRVVRHLLEPDPEKVEELKANLKTVEGEMPW